MRQQRYLGITTSPGRRHRDPLTIVRERPEFDTVQFPYNVADRRADKKR